MKKQIVPTLAGLMMLLGLCWYIDTVAHNEITSTVKVLIYAVAFAAII